MRLPDPVFMITIPAQGSRLRSDAVGNLTRFALWGVPTLVTEAVLLHVHTGHHRQWMALVAALLVLAIAVLLVNVRANDGGGTA